MMRTEQHYERPSPRASEAGPKRLPIEEVSGDIDPEELKRKYCDASKPVVIRGYKWPALKKWSFDHARDIYRGAPLAPVFLGLPKTGYVYDHVEHDHEAKVDLRAFIDGIGDPNQDPRYYIARILPSDPAWPDDVLDGFYFQKYALRNIVKVHLWIGSAGTRSGLHWDYHENLYCQVQGEKTFEIMHPNDVDYLYPARTNLDSSQVDMEDIDLVRFPKLTRATVYQTTLGPGDGLYLPTAWWHNVVSKSPSLSVNAVWKPTQNRDYLARVIRSSGPGTAVHVVKSFIFQGLLRNSPRRKLFCPAPTGEALYTQFAGALTRFLLRQGPEA